MECSHKDHQGIVRFPRIDNNANMKMTEMLLTHIYATRKSFSVIEWLDLFGQENLMKSDVLYCGQRLIKPLQLNAMIKFKGKAEEMRIASSCLDFRALSVKEEKE